MTNPLADRMEPEAPAPEPWATRLIDDLDEAARLLRDGGVVAFPTETVYGLGARFDDPAAIRHVFAAKHRPADNPLIVHLSDVDQLPIVARHVPTSALELLHAFAPGPLTVVVPRGAAVDSLVTAGHDTVAVRIPAEPTARALIRAVGAPLVAPSANRSGRPSPTRWEDVWEDLAGRIDGVLRGRISELGLESTVVDCSVDPPIVLRLGALPLEELQRVQPAIRLAGAMDLAAGRSPGLRHRHYSPRAKVIPVEAFEALPATDASGMCLVLSPPADPHWSTRFADVRVFSGADEYARGLYAAFREADARGLLRVYCVMPPADGVGRAIRDRLARASESG